MTILNALKGLYAKLGGQKSPDNIQTIGEVLEDITSVAGEGSGGGVFTIELSYDEGTSKTVMNKTVQEIIAAANSGEMLWVYYPGVNPSCGYVTNVMDNNAWYVSVALGNGYMTIDEEEKGYVPIYDFVAESLTDYPSNADF